MSVIVFYKMPFSRVLFINIVISWEIIRQTDISKRLFAVRPTQIADKHQANRGQS